MRNVFTLAFILVGTLISFTNLNAQDGTLDTTFGTLGFTTTPCPYLGCSSAAVAVQPNGKIIVAGSNDHGDYGFGDQNYYALARFHTNGTIDSTFGTNGKTISNINQWNDRINGIVIQPDGKIIAVGGSSTGFSGALSMYRYDINGVGDASFNNGLPIVQSVNGINDIASAVALQSNGKIVVCGSTIYNQFSRSGILLMRYTSAGIIDSTFGTNGILTAALDSSAYSSSMLVQSDDKIVLTGSTATHMVTLRYNINGTLDTTFANHGIAIDLTGRYGKYIVEQPDGKLVVCGNTNANEVFLTRYKSNGNIDTTFSGDGVLIDSLEQVKGLALQSDGKIVVGGSKYTQGYGFAATRYQSNGSLDYIFGINGQALTNTGSTGDNSTAMCLQSDEKIVFSGNSTGSIMVLRYNNLNNVTNVAEGKLQEGLHVFPNPAQSNVTLQSPNPLGLITIQNSFGQLVLYKDCAANSLQLDVSQLASGIYYITVNNKHCKLIKD